MRAFVCIYARNLMIASPLPYIAILALAVFATLAALDGVWLHLWKLRLHTRPASYGEHLWHTASALLFAPAIALLFVWQVSGAALWSTVALLVALHAVEVLDVRAERESRRELGGLSRFELSLHVAAVASRTIAVAAVLIARPISIWRLDGASAGDVLPSIVAQVGAAVSVGALAIAALHVVLAARYCPARCRRVAVGGGWA